MSRAQYQPQPGTIPFRVVEHLKTLPAGAEVSTPDLLEALGIQPAGPFSAYLVPAIKHGALVRTIRPRGSRQVAHWALGDGTPPAQAPAQDADETDAQLAATPRPRASAWAFPPRSVFELAEASAADGKPVVDDEPTPAPAPKPANLLGWTPAPPAAAAQVDPVSAEELADAVLASAAQPPVPKADAQQLAAYFAALQLTEQPEPDEPSDEPFGCALWSDGRLQLQRGDTELALLTADETKTLLHYLERMAVDA